MEIVPRKKLKYDDGASSRVPNLIMGFLEKQSERTAAARVLNENLIETLCSHDMVNYTLNCNLPARYR